jgi:hypothetical protein
MLLGGVEAMKISLKVKIIAIGVGAVLILGGTGVIVWHYQQLSQEATSDSSINQIIQKSFLSSDNKHLSANNKTISDDNASKLAENQNLDANNAKVSGQIIAPGTSNSNIDPNLTRKIDVYNGLMRLLPVCKELSDYRHNTGKEIENLENNNFDWKLINNGNIDGIQGSITSEGRIEIIPFNKQGQRIINDPYLESHMSAIREKENIVIATNIRLRTVLQEIDTLYPGAVKWWEDATLTGNPGYVIDNVLREYLGKELPWDGNTDYKNAKDFTP